MNRRVGFFLLAALMCLALVPVADSAYRVVPEGLAVTYVALAVLAGLDAMGKR